MQFAVQILKYCFSEPDMVVCARNTVADVGVPTMHLAIIQFLKATENSEYHFHLQTFCLPYLFLTKLSRGHNLFHQVFPQFQDFSYYRSRNRSLYIA